MSTRTESFIATVAPMAMEDYKTSNVLPSLTIAQAILESGWGESALALKANNLFGIKAGKDWTGKTYNVNTQEYYDGKTATTVSAYFRVYDSWAESIKDHSEFLQGKRYEKVLMATNYKDACEAVYQAGYATDPSYTSKLVSLVQRYGLDKYDTEVMGQSKPIVNVPEIYRVRKSWINAGSQLGAYSNLNNAKKIVDMNPGYMVFDSAGKIIYPEKPSEYVVKVTAKSLVIRKNPSGSSKKLGNFHKGDLVEIIAEENKWGKIKSGAGWISLRGTATC